MAARVSAVVLVFALGLLAVWVCSYHIRQEQKRQIELNLEDVARQNVHQIKLVLDFQTTILDALCAQMSDEQDPACLIDQLQPLVPIFNVKRIAFINPEGIAYSTDGYTVDLSYREFFQQGMRGEHAVTDVLQDVVSGDMEDVNVFSSPVYRIGTDEIMGVMFFAFPTRTFNQMLQMSSFGEQGSTCIFQTDGEIVASTQSRRLNIGENVYDVILSMSSENSECVAQMKTQVVAENTQPFQMTFFDGEEDFLFYFSEVDSHPGWYLTTVVPASVLSQRTEPVLNVIHRLFYVMVALLAFCAAVYLWTSHAQHQELMRMAYQDPLTGKDNYTAFREKMRNGTASGAGYVLSVDLRGFGMINNTCGIAKGDELIRAMGDVLEGELKYGELSAHVNGDRFVMFLHCPSEQDLINRIVALRSSLIDLSPQLDVPHIMPQFGVRAVDSPKRPEKSFSDANLAKQMIKERANCSYFIFDDKMRDQELEVQAMEDGFESALNERRFEMWYQPKYDPNTGQPVAAEALVRWRRQDGTLISPGKFIPLFERNGMIAQLDEYTFESVCRQQKVWLNAGKKLLPISINVSRASLYFDEIAVRYMVLIRRYDLPPDCIELEITESAMNGSENVDGILSQFRACGFRLLVDDFGSGYSSLSTLTKKSFDNIKIDKSLVDCIGQTEGEFLLESIIHMAHKFKMTITAEGVEKEYQMEFLRKLGCDNIQGYFYSRPLPSGDFEKLLKEPIAASES